MIVLESRDLSSWWQILINTRSVGTCSTLCSRHVQSIVFHRGQHARCNEGWKLPWPTRKRAKQSISSNCSVASRSVSLGASPPRKFLSGAAFSLTLYAKSHLVIHITLSRTEKRSQSSLLLWTCFYRKSGWVRTLSFQHILVVGLNDKTGKHFPIIIKVSLNLPDMITKKIASGYLKFKTVWRSELHSNPWTHWQALAMCWMGYWRYWETQPRDFQRQSRGSICLWSVAWAPAGQKLRCSGY